MAFSSALCAFPVGVSTPVKRHFLVLLYITNVFLFSCLYTGAHEPPGIDTPDDEATKDVPDEAAGALRSLDKPGGVPVPSIFQVSPADLPAPHSPPLRPPLVSSSSPAPLPPLAPASLLPLFSLHAAGGVDSLPDLLEANVFSRDGSSFGNVLVLTDLDDTLWSSGSMAAFGKHIGGIDSELARGLPYPGIGTCLFFLALGRHTCTPKGIRIPIEQCPIPLLSPLTHNCPVELHAPPKLPRSPGILSARASTSVLASLTRPASLYTDIEGILTSGAQHVYGTYVSRWPLGYRNTVRMMHVLSSQHARGAAKVEGFTEAVTPGTHAVVIGDTGEKDPEAAAGMAVKNPEGLLAVFMHSVFVDRQKELEAAIDPRQNSLPQHAISFFIKAGSHQIPAVQLVYEVMVCVNPGEMVSSFSDLNDHTAYAAGVQIAADVRQIFSASLRQQMLALRTRINKDRMPLQPLPPPLVFVHVAKLHTKTIVTPPETGMASQIASFSSKLASKVTSWSVKKFSQNPDRIDRAAFRQQATVQPVFRRTPVQRVTPQGVGVPLGVPFSSYRSTLGIALASFILGMMPVQDIVSLVVAAVRDLRSLGPPTHCWQRTMVQEMLADVISLEQYAGPLRTRTDLNGVGTYADAVDALHAFEAFHQSHCGLRENAQTPLTSCIRALEEALALHAANGAPGSVQELMPVLSIGCWYKDQLDHWSSAGSEEVESLTFFLGRALTLGMSSSGLPKPNKQKGTKTSVFVSDPFAAGQSQEMVLEQQTQLVQTRNNLAGELVQRRLQRDLTMLPELAVELHVQPTEPPSPLPPLLKMGVLDIKTVEDLKPFLQEENSPFSPDTPAVSSIASSNKENINEETEPKFEQIDDSSNSNINIQDGVSAPLSTWAKNLGFFCKNTKSSVVIDVCSSLGKWLMEVEGLPGADGQASSGALGTLIKVAEWNMNKPATPLLIPELGITLLPEHMRPGITGQGELEKANVLNVVGGISPGRRTVRHQRPSEAAVWQRITSLLKAFKELKFDPFATERINGLEGSR